MPVAEWSTVLSIAAISIEICFVLWYLLALGNIGRAIRDPESGAIDPVTLGLFGLVCVWWCYTVLIAVIIHTLPLPLWILIAIIAVDTLRIITATYFMWHLRLKYLWQHRLTKIWQWVKQWINV